MIKIGMYISGRYEIIEKVGAGGMADVYKARDNRLNRFVAIKVLKQEYSADTKFVTKFRAEAQSVAGLAHPNIVAVYDVGEENGLHYIVMELVEGITLKKYIEHKGKLDIKESLGISIQIAQGLCAAHANHIIHRDIKPQNIIISREGKVKVMDFGIAKAASSNTITSNAMGSVHYISPEQARGGFSDERSDIYSLGITMYEMLSGRVPFVGDSTVAVALAHIQEQAVPLGTIDNNIPYGIEMIVNKCMQKKPELRYLSVSDLITDLKRAVADPEGDFVKITPIVNDDSPTIHISDEDIKSIRNGAKTVVVSNTDEEDDLDLSDIEKEDEEESEVDPKLEKVVVIGSIAAGIILALIVIFIIVKFFVGGGSSDNPDESSVPSVSPVVSEQPDDNSAGYTLDDLADMEKQSAIAYINSLDLDISIETEERESDEVEEGRVISTNPIAGSTLSNGDTVTLIVSSGPEKPTVPDVSGRTQNEAIEILKDKGFESTTISYDNSDTVDIEKVIGTKPAKDEKVALDTKITIILSKGKATTYVKVPNLVGLTQAKAEKALKKAGLNIGNVSSAYSDTVPEGKVISQTQANGSEVEEDSSVGIVISLGPEVTYIYRGTITISDNPFTDSTQSAMVKFVLSQDGTSKVVGEGEMVMTAQSFPYTLTVEGSSESEGEIIMYVNGARYNAYNISFTKVAQ